MPVPTRYACAYKHRKERAVRVGKWIIFGACHWRTSGIACDATNCASTRSTMSPGRCSVSLALAARNAGHYPIVPVTVPLFVTVTVLLFLRTA